MTEYGAGYEPAVAFDEPAEIMNEIERLRAAGDLLGLTSLARDLLVDLDAVHTRLNVAYARLDALCEGVGGDR